jgi:peptidoglycan/xylan/chitin deacetylase (PgdA/CDA1 family)
MNRHGRPLLAATIAVIALSLASATVRSGSGTSGAAQTGAARSGPARSAPSAAGAAGAVGARGAVQGGGARKQTSPVVGSPDWTPGEDGPTGLGASTRSNVPADPSGPSDPSDPSGGAGTGQTGKHQPPTGGTTTAPGTPGTPGSPSTTGDQTASGSPTDTTPPLLAAGCPATTGVARHDAPGTGRTIALTFDDGPSAHTRAVLDVLAAAQVHATFFVVGGAVTADPQAVARAAAAGNLIGNHTWDHNYPRAVPNGWTLRYLDDQLDRTDAVVAAATGAPTCVFRPPGGFMPATVKVAAQRTREQVVLWSVDPRDWQVQGPRDPGAAGRAKEADRIYAAAIAGGSQQHPILLLHDGGGYRGATVAALPRIIAYYKAHGYRFVRLDGRS